MATTDRLLPRVWEHEVPLRTRRRPYAPAPNDYIAHRMTLEGPRDRLACDCGATFASATELEWHQHPYRNGGPS